MWVLHLVEIYMHHRIHRPPIDICFPWIPSVHTLAAVEVEERLAYYCIRCIMKWRRALLCLWLRLVVWTRLSTAICLGTRNKTWHLTLSRRVSFATLQTPRYILQSSDIPLLQKDWLEEQCFRMETSPKRVYGMKPPIVPQGSANQPSCFLNPCQPKWWLYGSSRVF